MLGAHGGRAAWSSARSQSVRTSPVRLTSPPSIRRAPPWVRLASPEAMAASWSALGQSRRSDTATGSPSADNHQRVGHPWGAVGEVADQPVGVAGFGDQPAGRGLAMVNEAGQQSTVPTVPPLTIECPGRLGVPARRLPEALLSAVPAATPFAGSPCTDRSQADNPLGDPGLSPGAVDLGEPDLGSQHRARLACRSSGGRLASNQRACRNPSVRW